MLLLLPVLDMVHNTSYIRSSLQSGTITSTMYNTPEALPAEASAQAGSPQAAFALFLVCLRGIQSPFRLVF